VQRNGREVWNPKPMTDGVAFRHRATYAKFRFDEAAR
jgi:hypothetical protein